MSEKISLPLSKSCSRSTQSSGIDDNSPDGTGAVADLLVKEDPRVHVLHRPGKQGLGKAYLQVFNGR